MLYLWKKCDFPYSYVWVEFHQAEIFSMFLWAFADPKQSAQRSWSFFRVAIFVRFGARKSSFWNGQTGFAIQRVAAWGFDHHKMWMLPYFWWSRSTHVSTEGMILHPFPISIGIYGLVIYCIVATFRWNVERSCHKHLCYESEIISIK